MRRDPASIIVKRQPVAFRGVGVYERCPCG